MICVLLSIQLLRAQGFSKHTLDILTAVRVHSLDYFNSIIKNILTPISELQGKNGYASAQLAF